jgi:structural maintenance of chromosome 4
MQIKAKTEHDEGLLEFLEDIIGSNRHLEAINEEEKKLDVLNEERGEKLSRLKVTETERDNLEGSKTEAEGVVRKSRGD